MSLNINCRTCFSLINDSDANSHKLSEKVFDLEITLSEVFTYCIGPPVESSSIICDSCEEMLIKFYDFKKKVFEIEEKFKAIHVKSEEDTQLDFKMPEVIFIEEEKYKISPKPRKRAVKKDSVKRKSSNGQENTDSNDTKLFVCDKCGRALKQKSALANHLLTHDSTHVTRCPHCVWTTKNQLYLYTHIKNVHSTTGSITCDICGKTLKHQDSLKTHMKLHNGPDIPCNLCEKVFKVKKSLHKHIQRTHHGRKKRYECTICSMNRYDKALIENHIGFEHQTELRDSDKEATYFIKSFYTTDIVRALN